MKKREKGQAETRLDLTNDLDVSRSVCVFAGKSARKGSPAVLDGQLSNCDFFKCLTVAVTILSVSLC